MAATASASQPTSGSGPASASENQLVFYTAECSVCLGHFEEDKTAIRLNCGHLFHEECIRSWLGVRDACPFCNTAGARGAMQHVKTALINDPTQLHELNVYVARGAMPLLCMWNASLLLTKQGREILIRIAIRRSLLRWVLNRFPNAGRVLTVILVVIVYIGSEFLAKLANAGLQKGLEFACDALGVISILNGFEYTGSLVQPVLLLLVMVCILLMCCINVRANTIVPAPLTGEFHPSNIYDIQGQREGEPMIRDVTEAHGTQPESVAACTPSAIVENPESRLVTSKRVHDGLQDEREEEPEQKRIKLSNSH